MPTARKIALGPVRWHVHVDGKTYGPYSEGQIRQMLEREQVISSDLVYAVGGNAWQKITDDQVLGAIFKIPPVRIAPPQKRTVSRKWLLAAISIVIAGWIAWPYYSFYDLAVGAKAGDVSVLEARVDWNSVREGLRGDLNAVFLRMVSKEEKKENDSNAALGQGIAVMLGPAIIDRMVGAYVTPQAIAADIRSEKVSDAPANKSAPTTQQAVGSRNQVPPGNTNGPSKLVQHIRQSEITYAFFSGSPFTFLVDLMPDNRTTSQQPIGLFFQWEGTWKLTRVILSPDLIDGLSSADASNPGGVGGIPQPAHPQAQ